MADKINWQICTCLLRIAGKDELSDIHEIEFQNTWNPATFLKEQKHDDSPYDQLGDVIAITETNINTQATICAQFMYQTWPLTGLELLEAVQYSLNVSHGGVYNC